MIFSIARIYDPLGWISLIVTMAKILLQDLWRCKIGWDASLPPALHTKWQSFTMHLSTIVNIRIPGWVGTSMVDRIKLHGFADVSQTAYVGAIYIICANPRGPPKSKLLIAKTRVAPVKTQTIPRLELGAAAMMVKLLHRVLEEFGVRVSAKYAWSDSRLTLVWLNHEHSRWAGPSSSLIESHRCKENFLASHGSTSILRIILQTWRHEE